MNFLLDESKFTNLVKNGYITYIDDMGRKDIHLTKNDIKRLILEQTISKGDINILIYNMRIEDCKEIIKRSPLYSDLFYDIS